MQGSHPELDALDEQFQKEMQNTVNKVNEEWKK